MRLFFAIIIIALNSAPGLAQEAEFGIKKATHKFPSTHEGTILEHTFMVKNTGDAPLIISDYEVECSCTKLEFPTDPIQPGETAGLHVSFDTTGKYFFQDRKIVVRANTKKGTHTLRIKVKVIPNEQ